VTALRRAIETRYSSARGVDGTIDSRLPTSQLLRLVADKSVDRLRGLLRGLPRTYVARGVRLRGRSQLAVGGSVSFGVGVLIDARGVQGVELGESVTVDDRAVLRVSGTIRELGTFIRVRDRTAIGIGNVLHGGGGITIGADCLLGPYCAIYSENHDFADLSVPIRLQRARPAAVVIGDDVWLGTGVTVLPGVTIGSGSVVAAGAVVVHDVPPMTVVAGVPARVVKRRSS